MNNILKHYINSRHINHTSAIGKYMQTKENDTTDNYIQQKQAIQDNYLSDKENQNQIDDIAERIVKAVDEIFGGRN